MDKVKHLPVKFKKPPGEEGRILKIVDQNTASSECNHRWFSRDNSLIDVTYLLREGETEVECGNCGIKLDPMWVLRLLATKESNWHHLQRRYQEEMERLQERSRTQCEHCGKTTRISEVKARSQAGP